MTVGEVLRDRSKNKSDSKKCKGVNVLKNGVTGEANVDVNDVAPTTAIQKAAVQVAAEDSKPLNGTLTIGQRSASNTIRATEAVDENCKAQLGTRVTDVPRDLPINGAFEGNCMWWCAFTGLVLLSLATRLYKIDEPDHICWDETHFGKFGSWYINRSFFFDVHPPLGKMMIGLFGVMSGYNGSFAFSKPGDKYGDVNYVGMRLCCALLGSCLVPFAYVIVWELSKSILAATLSAAFILFDNGILTLSQYILLDPILKFFIMGSVVGISKFRSYHSRSFTFPWWFWLCFTGTFLACSISVKFVGLFIFIYVGLFTAWDLWLVLGDLTRPIMYTVYHFLSRALCLILLPMLLYMTFFYIHLLVLSKSGSGDGFFSSAFQSQLVGNSLYNASMPKEVAYGAILTLKNHRTGGGYLHSHMHLYPEGVGARQQQITTYTHKDDNNKWMIKPYDKNPDSKVVLVRHGDAVRLEHVPTRRNLHSHKEPAPVSKRHHQVTGYGENGDGDANDVWRIEILDGKEGDVVTTITSRLRFIHYLSGCGLQSSNKQLPKWGYEQMEVSCNPNLRDKNNLWNVEDNFFLKLPNVSVEVYAPSFLQRFLESHAVMLQGNSGLKPKEGEVTSKPWQWPINFKGQYFSGNQYRIYLLGNPLVWWGNLLFLFLYLCLALFHAVKKQRGYGHSLPMADRWERMTTTCNWLLLGWLLHYVPFWCMTRVLYFHHYFPALLFSSMLSGVVLDFILTAFTFYIFGRMSKTIYHILVGVTMSLIVYSFCLYMPLAYGMQGPLSHEPNSSLSGLKLLDSWEF